MFVDTASEELTKQVTESLERHAPLQEVIIPAKYIKREPWVSKGILVSSQTAVKLHRNSLKKSKTDDAYKRHLKYRSLFFNIKRVAKQNYYANLFHQYRNNMRQLWKNINELIGKSNDKTSITSIFNIDGKCTADSKEIVNAFGKYYTNMGPNLAKEIRASRHLPDAYMRSKRHRNPHTLFMAPTNSLEILSILRSTKAKNSFGHDKLSTKIIKSIQSAIATPLSIVINKSLITGIVPTSFKLAKIKPIYKAKAKDDIMNYRPISLLPSFSKILEKVVHSRVYNFFTYFNMLSHNQFGFQKNHSTIDALTRFINDTTDSLDRGSSMLAVYIDLSRAFDTLNHEILLQKLELYGIRGVALEWFRSYLTDRKQYIEYNNVTSDTHTVLSGIPQGSVLGPLLFIIYINDLPDAIEIGSILFADDTTIFCSHKDIPTLYAMMNNQLDIVNDWFRSNKLSLNNNKTNYVLFTLKSVNEVPQFQLKIEDNIIESKSNVKFLGLYIDQKLRWNYHIDNLKLKMSKALFAINKAKHVLPRKYLRLLYNSLVYSHLTYGVILWGAAFHVHINKIVIMQKKIIRAICGARYDAHTDPLFREIQLIKFTDIHKYHSAKFVYKNLTKSHPRSLLNLFTVSGNVHQHRTRHSLATGLILPGVRTTLATQNIRFIGARIWNDIPRDLYLTNNDIFISLASFLSRLKKHILSKY